MSGGYRILLADDDAERSMVTSMVLEKAGYEVEWVEQTQLVTAAMQRLQPDLLVVSVEANGLSNDEHIRRLGGLDRLGDTPVIFLSGEQNSGRETDVLDVGADEALVRPVSPQHLISAVGAVIQGLQELPDPLLGSRQCDPVTGLLNRDGFLETLQQLLNTGGALAGEGGVLFMELDNPRKIHERLSISGTDELLREFGKLIAGHAGPDDVLARFGDYSFALMVCRRRIRETLDFAEQLRQQVEEQLFSLDGPSITVTLSIGACIFDGRMTDAQRMVVLSEKACGIAAEAGGNLVHVHKELAPAEGDDQEAGGMMEMLQECLASDGFQLFFQPVVGLRNCRAGPMHQVLLRMGNQQDEFQQAQDFIPVAERLGILADLDRWVIERTLRYLTNGEFGAAAAPQFLVVLSLASLRTPDLAHWLEQKLKEHGVSGRHFNFAVRFADVEVELKTVESHVFRLRKLGARITLTDFGETPGAFNYLKRILVDYLRVPMGLLDKRGDELAELVRKAHDRHKPIIVPGVEAPRHMDVVWSSGADFVQGYFIQRPQARPDFDFSGLVLG